MNTEPEDRVIYTDHDQSGRPWRLVARICEHSHEEFVQRQRWSNNHAWEDVPGLPTNDLQKALLGPKDILEAWKNRYPAAAELLNPSNTDPETP